jgi:hypothetical protein
MRKVLFVASAVCLLASAFAVSASASEQAWTIYIAAGWAGTWDNTQGQGAEASLEASTVATVLDDPTVKDPRDGQVTPATMDSAAFVQWWRPFAADGSYGMFIRDTRKPLNTVPNLVKSWDNLIVWAANGAMNTYTEPSIKLFFSAKGVPNTVEGKAVAYKLVMTYAPEGYAGQREWVLPPSPGADSVRSDWFTLTLPSAGAIMAAGTTPISGTGAIAATQNGGYRFSLVTPEPGSMMVLASGLVGLVGLVSRRRSA